jgi:CRP/FNR family transcriptional regulator, cyclic AMP receptor protein
VEELLDHLKQVPLFNSLSQRQLKRLMRDFKERRVRSGTPLVQRGQMSGVDFFVIVEGEASVTVGGAEVGRLRPGDHFGELALIGGQVRQATVTADGPMRCLVMASWNFRRFVQDNPDVSWKLLQYLVSLVTDERNRGVQARSQPERNR